MKESIELHTIGTFRGKEYEMQDLLNSLLEENIRLNNVIDKIYNEVLNTTEEMYKTLVKIDGRGYYSASLTRLDYLLDKIRKLKGDDKE